ncbi:hypothetical protein BBO99_00004692 [Phytophthora kernoviae]|uniref:Uncharacterized protein n=2 Tax=Phytophthora kernoviae TaxID=325452 RepID=A0A3R7NGP5_9STRA|nr:hypothetical protein G195_009829 [Phytophthora kernoviae 00238/432]KAG2527161.1 hypothetical protein JM18_003994 [Phytophthora kernoviae]KAG2528729.1 hypothetical protein JM16_002544 [Phytophthora kernoviae]RLN37928.1 hypothetical protein BBI17_002929 [Phytophthora kernoviae]RLN80209.1 hypothetical protein BBO99_00004692 [Phytophthora kernoviae]
MIPRMDMLLTFRMTKSLRKLRFRRYKLTKKKLKLRTVNMARMPTSMPKASRIKEHGAKQAASETVDEMLSEAEKMRQRQDVEDGLRRTSEQLKEDVRNLKEYAQDKMGQMSDVVRDAAESARKTTGFSGGAKSPAVPTDTLSDSVMESLKTASEQLSAEISDLGERVESVKARVSESMQAAGGRAAKTWYQSSEAAKNVGEREYCLPLPTNRICARHVAFVAIPLLVMLLMFILRRRYPKKWNAGIHNMKQPQAMLSHDTPADEQLQDHVSKTAGTIHNKAEYTKQRAGGLMGEMHSQYAKTDNKKDQ